ncbi:hypothetical protein HPB52_012129 [Rhipicephalus sanguineus]|uniref:Uncharacterized protein n=1 Tax=Rhipicephalus sanguineus TaxID=34632 RepID=A0A9D4QA08_RHISA|nr:hypothetical protein HPB52_012129 [Rhipicephalus sanguineus]
MYPFDDSRVHRARIQDAAPLRNIVVSGSVTSFAGLFKLYRAFPPEVWTEISRHMAIEYLLNMAEAAHVMKCFVLSPDEFADCDRQSGRRRADDQRVSAGNTPGARHLQPGETLHVQELRLPNCLAQSSEVILGCAAICEDLRELNCVLETAELFLLLSTTLASVTKLECELHEARSRLSTKVSGLISGLPSPRDP